MLNEEKMRNDNMDILLIEVKGIIYFTAFAFQLFDSTNNSA